MIEPKVLEYEGIQKWWFLRLPRLDRNKIVVWYRRRVDFEASGTGSVGL